MTANTERKSPLLKLALEMGPLLMFFLANAARNCSGRFCCLSFRKSVSSEKAGIFSATAVFMVSMSISLVTTYLLMRKLPIMPLVSGAVVAISAA